MHIYLSTLAHKLCMAVRTGNIDLPSSARHTQALLAVGAFKVPMCLTVSEPNAGIMQAR